MSRVLLRNRLDPDLPVGGGGGSLTHGASYVHTGSGFGTKATAAPLVYETFADGNAPADLIQHGSDEGSHIIYNNTNNLRHGFSSYNCRNDYKIYGSCYWSYDDAGTQPKWFVQYWIKLASNWVWGDAVYPDSGDGLANIKIFRMYDTGGNYTNTGVTIHGFEGDPAPLGWFAEAEIGGNGTNAQFDDGEAIFSLNTWHLVQVQYGENSSSGAADGVMKFWVDGALLLNKTNFITNVTSDGAAVNKRPYVIGWYDSWSPSDAGVANMYAYYSDIYVDDAWSRVELGNASTYTSCTIREMQLPTAWSSTSITLTVNKGALSTGTVYLYVTDSAGATAASVAVTIN